MVRGSAQPAGGLGGGDGPPRAGPEELERCLFAETLEVVAAGDQPRDRAGGQRWVAARWAPYERAGEPVRSCLLVQAGTRSRQDGVPGSSTLKGEPGAAWGVVPPPPSPGLEHPRPTGHQGWDGGQCRRGGLNVALLCQPT